MAYRSRMANETARKLRSRMTRQEVKLWLRLRELRKLGFHFRRQPPINDFIVDCACFNPRVVVELDDSQHSRPRQASRDAIRDAKLAADGFRIVRVGIMTSTRTLKGFSNKSCMNWGVSVAPHPGVANGAAGPPHQGEGWSSWARAKQPIPSFNQSMNWPPLMVSVEPVIQAASSAARNTTQRATSAASPSRPTGIWPTIDFITSSETPASRSVFT